MRRAQKAVYFAVCNIFYICLSIILSNLTIKCMGDFPLHLGYVPTIPENILLP